MTEKSGEAIQRQQKLENLRAQGVNPYPNRYPLTHNIGQLLAQKDALVAEATPVATAGRVVSMRWHGKVCFFHIYSHDSQIQVYTRKDSLGEKDYGIVSQLDMGDFVGIKGPLFITRTGELTIQAQEVTMLAKSLHPLPEKWHGLKDIEIRYRQRYLDLLSNPEVRQTFILRTRIVQTIRDYLNGKGFMEVETPMMQPIPGGASARPFVTHHNALDRDLYLRIAPELYLKRLLIGGFEKVYEINRNFRNEGLSTEHNPEFTMLEFYTAYSDYEKLMLFTEDLFSTLAQQVLGKTVLTYGGSQIDLASPWQRLTMEQAVVKYGQIDPEEIKSEEGLRRIIQEKGIQVAKQDLAGHLLVKLFEHVAEPQLIQPTFIIDFPKTVSPLAKSKPLEGDHPQQPELVERFELFIGGKEIANAFTELNDPQDQRERFQMQMLERQAGDEEAQRLDEDFLQAMEHGMPPAAGEGIGIDRLVMLFSDSPSIRDVILFPQLRQ